MEPKARLVNCLFRQNEFQKTGKMIKDMWGIRRNKLKDKDKNRKGYKNIINHKKKALSDPGPKRDDRGRISLREEHWNNVGLVFGNNRGV